MIIKRAAPWIVALLLLTTSPLRGQTLSGAAEWTVTRGANDVSSGESTANRSFWQRYTVGFETPILDPRLAKCSVDASFRTSGLSSGSQDDMQEGQQRDVAYHFAASGLSGRPFPFFLDVARDDIGETGAYPSTAGIRGGVPLAPGAPPPDFRMRNRTVAMGWQLNLENYPRVEVAWHRATSQVSGGPYDAEQEDGNVHVGVYRDKTNVRQALRYDRYDFANTISQVFDQRMADLDYDFNALLGGRSRLHGRVGRRTTVSQFDLAAAIVDPGTGSYAPPSRGEVDGRYAIGGVTYEPNGRLSLDVSGNVDRQDSAAVTTSARLATATARYDPARGLSLTAIGTYGSRGQQVADDPIDVATRTGQAGFTYRAGGRWIEAHVGAMRGAGVNVTPEGDTGRIRLANQAAGVSLSTWLRVTIGYDRTTNTDDLLAYGNYDNSRQFAAVERAFGGAAINVSFDNAVIRRGRADTYAANHQQTFTGGVSYRTHEHVLSANTGGFTNRSELGDDRTLFWGASYQAAFTRRLHALVWGRRELTTASETRLDQRTVVWFASLEYRYRQFRFAGEYRKNDQNLFYERLAAPYLFRGYQVLLHISRTFGVRL
jgi:hypothetical protein